MSARLARAAPPATVGIVHLGPGAFFRAHLAVYTADAMAAAGGDWGIAAVSLRSAGPRDLLQPQGCAYTSVTLAPDGARHRVIDSIACVLVAPEDPDAVLAQMAAPSVHVVSLTVTEKGYCHLPATGRLDRAHADIVHDLAHPGAPRSAPGFVIRALERRRAAGLGAFTVLSCDNLPANGALLRGVVLEMAEQIDPALAAWIDRFARFPGTMVDRITPATTARDIAALEQAAGWHDPAMVAHEPFCQWVIEDDFAGPRPAWEQVGAQLVRDVAPHELMKLRCLNGTHSTLAYLGYLAGHETIADCAADPVFAGLCRKLWAEEILPTVPRPEGEDLHAYTAALLERYSNPAIRHRTWQIAMDGSQKLPQRLLGTIADRLAQGVVPRGLCLAVAGWMRYVSGRDEHGVPIDVRDPLADRLRAAHETADPVAALLAMPEVFPQALAGDARFAVAVTDAFDALTRVGARQTITEYLT